MANGPEIRQLKNQLAQYEQNSRRTKWLLRQLRWKIRNAPREFYERMQRSLEKRRKRPSYETNSRSVQASISSSSQLASSAASDYKESRPFYMSEKMVRLVDKARDLEPEIGILTGKEQHLFPLDSDQEYKLFKIVLQSLPKASYDAVVLMPAGRMGGADLVAALLARALSQNASVLILRTDASDWDFQHWYADNVDSVDISKTFKEVRNKERALYLLLSKLRASKIFNVNSRLAFETFMSYGKQLSRQSALYAYYFCADRTPEGYETGYPVWYFHPLLQHLDAALFDTHYLANVLAERYAIPDIALDKLKPLYTPAQVALANPPMAERVANPENSRRPRILWAGRLDRQKRFDRVKDIARAMPDVDFLCWGKAVLDAPQKNPKLPSNMTLNPPFNDYNQLPLSDCEGWLYTSDWDGLPTILIELGALGVPIVASAVGGVPELIDDSTGWPVPENSGNEIYIAALREMIANPDMRVNRAKALQARVQDRHAMDTYANLVSSL